MIQRQAQNEVELLAKQFKAVAVIGPRQSGKTTLVRAVFDSKVYVSLENPDIRLFAREDPRGFLANYPDGAILDEVQHVPILFSYLQQILDESNTSGLFILTGSNNFLLQENISQSLAGRVGYLHLLPLSIEEIGEKEDNINRLLLKGGYPYLYSTDVAPSKWFANYIRTYIERDVRQIKNILNLSAFDRFLRLCAGRIGQLLNMSSLATETGVDVKTIDAWLGILEMSFILFRLQPYYKNYNKRIVKMPKIYFYDTGIALALLGIDNEKDIAFHPYRGNLFENIIILELIKRQWNIGKERNIFFWRDNVGHEVDIIIDNGKEQIPIEVKSGQTITSDYFNGLNFWNKITNSKGGYVIYGGKESQIRSDGIIVRSYNNIGSWG